MTEQPLLQSLDFLCSSHWKSVFGRTLGAIDFYSALRRCYNLWIHMIHWLLQHECRLLDWSHVFVGGRSVIEVSGLHMKKHLARTVSWITAPLFILHYVTFFLNRHRSKRKEEVLDLFYITVVCFSHCSHKLISSSARMLMLLFCFVYLSGFILILLLLFLYF